MGRSLIYLSIYLFIHSFIFSGWVLCIHWILVWVSGLVSFLTTQWQTGGGVEDGKVVQFGDKVREVSLKWFRHVQRRDGGHEGRTCRGLLWHKRMLEIARCLLRLDLQALRGFSRGGLIDPNIDSIDTSAGIGIGSVCCPLSCFNLSFGK